MGYTSLHVACYFLSVVCPKVAMLKSAGFRVKRRSKKRPPEFAAEVRWPVFGSSQLMIVVIEIVEIR